MSAFPIKRTPEQGHTRQCHARVMMLCLMGWVQAPDITDMDYRFYVQDNGALAEADELLKNGVVECLCDPLPEPTYESVEPMEVPC